MVRLSLRLRRGGGKRDGGERGDNSESTSRATHHDSSRRENWHDGRMRWRPAANDAASDVVTHPDDVVAGDACRRLATCRGYHVCPIQRCPTTLLRATMAIRT